MKNILYTTLLLFAFCFTAQAQKYHNANIVIDNLQTEITSETLDINFSLKASGLKLRCDGQLMLEFAVESTDRRLVLPTVIYSGNRRYRYERRRELLSSQFHMEPYHIYKNIKENKSYELNYVLSIPYYTWMEHASITCREYTHDCSGNNLTNNEILVADLNPTPAHAEPEIWEPNSALFSKLVSFLVPEVEEVKARASLLELNIGYPVNVTEVRPPFGNNTQELKRTDSLIHTITNNQLLTVNGVNIRGYASPEGRYAVNDKLAKGRSEGFRQYLTRKYSGNSHIRNAHTSWIAEDWEGLARLVEESELPYKDEVLAVVLDNSIAPDTKEQILQKIGQWSYVYKVILNDMFPKLRRIELKVDYTVQKIDDHKARELLYTQPELLSLEEIYRVARYYEPDSRQYREVYEIAAKQYPDDVIANNNAAAALLQEGNAEAALPYLEKIKDNSISFINYGAYYYISNDLDTAIEYFKKAKAADIEQANHNLNLVIPGQN